MFYKDYFAEDIPERSKLSSRYMCHSGRVFQYSLNFRSLLSIKILKTHFLAFI